MAAEDGLVGWTVEDFETDGGERPVRSFIDGLVGRDLSEAIALVKLVEDRGNRLRAPHSKALGGGLFELRGKQVRIFYVFARGRRVILLSGIVKKRSEIPARALARARRIQADWERRERGKRA